MELNRQNILTMILIPTLLLGAYMWYTYFFKSTVDESAIVAKEPLVSQEFLAVASLLDTIKIDTEFFNNEAFLELIDGAKRPSPPENRGRINPFAGF